MLSSRILPFEMALETTLSSGLLRLSFAGVDVAVCSESSSSPSSYRGDREFRTEEIIDLILPTLLPRDDLCATEVPALVKLFTVSRLSSSSLRETDSM